MKRERNKEYTRKKIIESAIELFSIQDYQKTSVEEISKKAGVTKTTFFVYFKSKEELLFDLDLEQLKVFDQQITLAIEDSQQLLTKLREAIVHMAVNLHKTQTITRNLIHLGTISTTYKELLSQTFSIMQAIITRAVAHGQEKEVITKRIHATSIADNLVTIYIGILIYWSFLDEKTNDLKKVMDEGIKNYFTGILD